MGSPGVAAGSYADTAKRLAGRSLLAAASGLATVAKGVSKGVSALTASNSDKEVVHCLEFAVLEWADVSADGTGVPTCAEQQPPHRRLPVLLVGLESGFQVWRLDGENPAELVSRRDGPVKGIAAVPEPRAGGGDGAPDELSGDRPLLAVVPAPERATSLPPLGPQSGAAQTQQTQVQQPQQQQHILQLYSLRSHGYVRSLSFGGEVLGVQASGRLLVVALRGQLQAFDARTLQHTFSCLTYTPPARLLPPPASGGARLPQQEQQQFITAGLTSGSAASDAPRPPAQQAQQPAGAAAGAAPQLAALAPFALGPRWLAYAADTPVPQANGQAVAQRLPLGRQDSRLSTRSASGSLDGQPSLGSQPGASPAGRGSNGLTSAAVADAALAAAAKGGQQLRSGLSAVGSASFKYLSQQYASWRQGGQQLQQHDLDALEADAAVAGTVVVRDAVSRLVVAHFRAHTSPLAALQFSPGGTLLATASVAGHSINVFSIVPPAPAPGLSAGEASGGCSAGAGAGHAMWLYRLYRGLTPAAIRGITFAPDASWVAVSSGRGTTHLFRTPAAAPGAHAPEQAAAASAGGAAASAAGRAGEAGVVGQPLKLLAVGRARKPGLLSGGAASAATSAARQLYSGQPADATPIAAAFLAGGPRSPRAAGGSGSSGEGASGDSSLYVVTQDGLLTRHLLRMPPAENGGGTGPDPSSRGGNPQLPADRQDAAAAGVAAGAAPPAVLEEADRWDVARHASWPEREELLPGVAAGAAEAAAAASDGAAAAGTAMSAAAAGAEAAQQQVWVAQAEAGALAGSAAGGSGRASSAPLPLWGDPQFRFFELRVQQLQRQRSVAAGGAEAVPPGVPAAGDNGDGEPAWLEHLPAHPVQQ
ncbi:hypothetical protein ABPG75_004929 [Micractinium tetrahymenae]